MADEYDPDEDFTEDDDPDLLMDDDGSLDAEIELDNLNGENNAW